MSRYGWIALSLAVIALAVYLFRPADTAEAHRTLLAGRLDAEHVVIELPDLRQELRGDELVINGLERDPDPQAVSRMRRGLARLQWSERVAVAADELPAYGIDGSRCVALDGERIAWGVKRDVLWVHDPAAAAVFACGDAAVARGLRARLGRLDRPDLLPSTRLVALALGGRRLVADGTGPGRWVDAERPAAPPYDHRVAALLRVFAGFTLGDLDGVALPATAEQVASCRLERPTAAALELRLFALAGRHVVELVGYPPQVCDPAAAAAWQETAARFATDYLLNIDVHFVPQPLEEVVATRGSQLLVRLDRDSTITAQDLASPWSVTWPEGHGAGADTVGETVFAALNDIPLVSWQRRDAPLWQPAPDPEAVTIRCDGHGLGARGRWLRVAGDQVQSAWYVATARRVPELLRAPGPVPLLDDRLIRVARERLAKLQRVVVEPQAQKAEILARGAGGWSLLPVQVVDDRREPGERRAADPVAIERLVRALQRAPAPVIALAAAADEAIGRAPGDRRLMVRIVPPAVANVRDGVALGDTVVRDWRLALRREGEQWRGVDLERGVVRRFGPELIESLFASVTRTLVLSALPSQIQAIAFDLAGEDAASDYTIERGAEGWALVTPAGRRPCEDAVVRRYLRFLTRLEALAHDAQAPAPEPDGPLAGSLRLRLPGVGVGDEHLILHIAPVTGEQPVAVGVRGDAADDAARPGRLLIPAAAARRLLPPAAFFATAEAR